MKGIFKKLKWFYKYFGGSHIMDGRTYDNSIRYVINDPNERKMFLEAFYDECPPITFLDETDKQKYYILKSNWQIVSYIITLKKLFHFRTLHKFPKYIWWTIKDICHVHKQYDWYMHPDKNKRIP